MGNAIHKMSMHFHLIMARNNPFVDALVLKKMKIYTMGFAQDAYSQRLIYFGKPAKIPESTPLGIWELDR
ncbi:MULTISPECIES: hypothetical protein [unclassified Endozoicomonas]|uniref:hypothetical protein n=1 Tax=unclassified Endozoicomonas TaxID=2644528 RepID=UPI003BAF2CC1